LGIIGGLSFHWWTKLIRKQRKVKPRQDEEQRLKTMSDRTVDQVDQVDPVEVDGKEVITGSCKD